MDTFLECNIKTDEGNTANNKISDLDKEGLMINIGGKVKRNSRRNCNNSNDDMSDSDDRTSVKDSESQTSDEDTKLRKRKTRRAYAKRGKSHSKVEEEGKRKYPCDLCSYASTRPADLRRHFLRLHMNPLKRSQGDTVKKKRKEKQLEMLRKVQEEEELEAIDGKVKHSAVVKGRKRGPKMKYAYDKTFPCSLCTYKSTRKFDLKRHIASVHNKEKPYVCDVCDYSTGLAETLKQHMLRVHNEMKFKCVDCNISCLNQTEYTKHLMEHHDYHPHRCNVCPFSCTTYLQLKKHIMKIHKDLRPFRCSICDYSSCHRGNLVKHVNEAHSTDIVHRCDMCGFATKNGKYELALHKKSEHKKNKEKRPRKKKTKMEDNDQHIFDVILQSNNLAFINSQLETNNIPIITPQLSSMPVITLSEPRNPPLSDLPEPKGATVRDPNLNYCDFCTFKSSSRLDLECHLVDFHSLDKVFVCSKCSFTTPRKFNFKNHLKFKHSTPDEELEKLAVECMKCEKVHKRPSPNNETTIELPINDPILDTSANKIEDPDKMVVEDHFLLGQTLGPIPPSPCQPVQNHLIH